MIYILEQEMLRIFKSLKHYSNTCSCETTEHVDLYYHKLFVNLGAFIVYTEQHLHSYIVYGKLSVIFIFTCPQMIAYGICT